MATYAILKTRLADYGFDYVADAKRGEFINTSYLELCDLEDWPFLEATTSGTAPLTIPDLRTVEVVIDSTSMSRLTPRDRRHILETDYTLGTAGSPGVYYLTGGDTVNAYPANTTDTISVRYWQVPDELTSDGTEPLSPDRFDDVILYGARALGYWDSDNAEMAEVMVLRQERRLQTMRDVLLTQQHDQPDDSIMIVAGSADW